MLMSAGVTPTGVTPAGVTPAAVTPTGVTPGAVTRAVLPGTCCGGSPSRTAVAQEPGVREIAVVDDNVRQRLRADLS